MRVAVYSVLVIAGVFVGSISMVERDLNVGFQPAPRIHNLEQPLRQLTSTPDSVNGKVSEAGVVPLPLPAR